MLAAWGVWWRCGCASGTAAQRSWRGGSVEGVSARSSWSSAHQRALLCFHQLRMWEPSVCFIYHHTQNVYKSVRLAFVQLWAGRSDTLPCSYSSVCFLPVTATRCSVYFTSCLRWPITRKIPGTVTDTRWVQQIDFGDKENQDAFNSLWFAHCVFAIACHQIGFTILRTILWALRQMFQERCVNIEVNVFLSSAVMSVESSDTQMWPHTRVILFYFIQHKPTTTFFYLDAVVCVFLL